LSHRQINKTFVAVFPNRAGRDANDLNAVAASAKLLVRVSLCRFERRELAAENNPLARLLGMQDDPEHYAPTDASGRCAVGAGVLNRCYRSTTERAVGEVTEPVPKHGQLVASIGFKVGPAMRLRASL
jgi:hypothetical protein